MSNLEHKHIYCFGEVLWDVFPNEKKVGGAPLNVAYHLKQFGLNPKVISCVGEDELGSDLLDFVTRKGLDTSFIQSSKAAPTGTVQVKLSKDGNASYDITFPSAWDYINHPHEPLQEENVLVFGSLASRNETSRNTLLSLLQNVDLALFDVNFRSPHYTRALVEQLMLKSNIIKINEDEIEIIGSWIEMEGAALNDICQQLLAKFELEQIIVTLGADGAMVCTTNGSHQQDALVIEVEDTVGSGDSFLAAYLANFLQRKSIDDCLKMACATGAFVATQKGATPDYEVHKIEQMILA